MATWLTILDADDRFSPGGLEVLGRAALGGDAAVVVGQQVWIKRDRRWITGLYDSPDVRRPGRKSLGTNPGLVYFVSPHAKLIHRSCWDGLQFSGRLLGDQSWVIRALLRAGDRIEVLGENVYEWRRAAVDSHGSITTRARSSVRTGVEAAALARQAFDAVAAEAALRLDEAPRRRLLVSYIERQVRSDLVPHLDEGARSARPGSRGGHRRHGVVRSGHAAGAARRVPALRRDVLTPALVRWHKLDRPARAAFERLVAATRGANARTPRPLTDAAAQDRDRGRPRLAKSRRRPDRRGAPAGDGTAGAALATAAILGTSTGSHDDERYRGMKQSGSRGLFRQLAKRVVHAVSPRRSPERQGRKGAAPGAFTTEATTAFRQLAAHPDPYLLAAYPSYTANPYQDLLYGAASVEGFATVRMPRWRQLSELLALQDGGLSTVLHLHWLQPVLRDAGSEADARARVARFAEDLDTYRARGGRLVWTVHNVLPHEMRFEAAEIDLCVAVAERADVIHVLVERTPELVAPYYELPRERVLHVPHPSYQGVYPDHVSRDDARRELGLMPDEFVVAAVGDIRPYKGLDDLLDAWQDVPTDRPRRLLIAGAPLRDQRDAQAIVERAGVAPRVQVDARRIPPEELQVIFRAADVMILPYRRALNSGALLLALTFGVPVIVPEAAGFAEIVDPSFARTFRAGDRASLADVLTRAPELATEEAAQSALRAAARYEPRAMSERFVRELRARLQR